MIFQDLASSSQFLFSVIVLGRFSGKRETFSCEPGRCLAGAAAAEGEERTLICGASEVCQTLPWALCRRDVGSTSHQIPKQRSL